MAQSTVVELMHRYRDALETASSQSPESERTLYVLHQTALAELEVALKKGASAEVNRILRVELRAFGLSYLSGSFGQRVEDAFDALATELEKE